MELSGFLRYGADIRGIFRSLIDISRNLILVEFSKIPRLVELGGFLEYIYISRNFKLVGPSRFFKF